MKHLSNQLTDFYTQFDNIVDYYLLKKEERLNGLKQEIDNNLLFNQLIHPNDMDIVVEEIDNKNFHIMTTSIATFPIENQIGRRMLLSVKERNTNTFLGFIRLSSPVLSIKPRNNYFGQSLDNKIVNNHFYNGSVIVPVQPFGFNYLGGKLLSLVCVSNQVREMFNKKYNTNLVVFETTSLYGNSKSMSMYDGLEPYIKYYGNTESKNFLLPTDNVYFPIRNELRESYGIEEYNGNLTNPNGSTPKSREFMKCIQIIKNNLTGEDLRHFKYIVDNRLQTIEQKRYYMSFMGFKNVKEHILFNEELIQDSEKYDLNHIIDYWKKKSTKRYEKLKDTNSLKTELELYKLNNIKNKQLKDIIR